MSLRTFTHEQISRQCRQRPADYRDRLMQAAVEQDAHGVRFDTQHPAWRELKRRFATRPRPSAGQVVSLSQAILAGRYVAREVQASRLAICQQCEYLRTDQAGHWCGLCGCSVSAQGRQVTNLAAYEENLPRWGCKHPRREQGAGWLR